MHIAFIAVAIALSLCAGRLLQLQGFDSATYSAIAAKQLTQTLPLLPARGEITDRNGVVMAATEAAVAITADPTLTTPNADKIADIMSKYMTIERPAVVAALTKPKTRFSYVQKKVPALVYSKIAADLTAADIPGVYRESDPIRTYPNGSVGASVVGFVGADGKGLGGFEWSMNSELAGVEGTETYEASPNGGKIPLGESKTTPVKNGLNYSLDPGQRAAVGGREGARGPGPGDRRRPRHGGRAQHQDRRGAGDGQRTDIRLVQAGVGGGGRSRQPGGLCALRARQRRESADRGRRDRLRCHGRRAADHPRHPGHHPGPAAVGAADASRTRSGTQELHYLLRGVIADSSNIGAALFSRQMPKAELRAYLKKFGLGQPTGIELPGEAAGILPPGDMPDYSRDQIAFGQAVSR